MADEKSNRNYTSVILSFIIGLVLGAVVILASNYVTNLTSNKIIGTWQVDLNGNQVVFNFDNNNTVILSSQYTSVKGIYKTENNVLSITINDNQTSDYYYKFLSYNSLSLIQVGQNNGNVLSRIV